MHVFLVNLIIFSQPDFDLVNKVFQSLFHHTVLQNKDRMTRWAVNRLLECNVLAVWRLDQLTADVNEHFVDACRDFNKLTAWRSSSLLR